MLLKLLPILVVVALAHCRSANNDSKDLDALIDEIFGKEPNKGSVVNPAPASVVNPTEGPVTGAVCNLPSGGQGVCTKYYLCSTAQPDTENYGVLDIRIDSESCGSYIDVCCDNTKA